MATQRRYVVDQKGKRTAVVVDIGEFERMRQRLEDLEDALELKTAVETEKEFRDFAEIQEEERAKPRRSSGRK